MLTAISYSRRFRNSGRIYDDRSWLLIRKSGTEPLIRVYADAPTQERAEQLVQQGEELVKKAVSQL